MDCYPDHNAPSCPVDPCRLDARSAACLQSDRLAGLLMDRYRRESEASRDQVDFALHAKLHRHCGTSACSCPSLEAIRRFLANAAFFETTWNETVEELVRCSLMPATKA